MVCNRIHDIWMGEQAPGHRDGPGVVHCFGLRCWRGVGFLPIPEKAEARA